MESHIQYIPLEYNNNNDNIKHSGMVLMVLRSNGMLLSHFKGTGMPSHLTPTPPQSQPQTEKYTYFK
jgi:hypothetical protein